MDTQTMDELKALKHDVAAIQDDLKELTIALKTDGRGKFENVASRIGGAAADIENRIKEQLTDTYGDVRKAVREKSSQAADAGRQQIAKRPYTTVLVAFLGGFVLSRLIWKK